MKESDWYFVKERGLVHAMMLISRSLLILFVLLVGLAAMEDDPFMYSAKSMIASVMLAGWSVIVFFNLRYLYQCKSVHNRMTRAVTGLSFNEFQAMKASLPQHDAGLGPLLAVSRAKVDEQYVASEVYARQ